MGQMFHFCFVLLCFVFLLCPGAGGKEGSGEGSRSLLSSTAPEDGGWSLDDTSETSLHVGSVPRVFLE